MAMQGSDLFLISRAGTHYALPGSAILSYIQSNIGTSEYEVANITARNALSNMSVGDRVFVTDATGDATVSAGWAIYVYRGPGVWTKVAEQEGLDVVIGGTNLSLTAGTSSIALNSSSGDDVTIPAATASLAGLLLPADFTKLGYVTVTAATNLDTIRAKVAYLTVTANTDLDAIRSASHAAVTLAGSATTNPLVLSGQQLNFSIANLATAP